jgi:hypothetical protein
LGIVSSPEATVARLADAATSPDAMAEVPGSTAEMPLVTSQEDYGAFQSQEPFTEHHEHHHDEHGGDGNWG